MSDKGEGGVKIIKKWVTSFMDGLFFHFHEIFQQVTTTDCLIIHLFVFTFQVESELIDKLDILVSENKGDEDYKHLFNSM